MTALAEQGTSFGWNSMPGWAVVADLTPPELGEARRLRTLKRIIAACLLTLVLLCVGGYVLAGRGHSKAQDQLNVATGRTTALTAQQHRYDDVTQVRTAIDGVRTQLGTLFAGDIDTAGFLAKLSAALPAGMTLTSVNLSVTNSSPDLPSTSDASGTSTAAAGTVTLSGTSSHLVDLAAYVTALGKLRGVSNVVPSTNSRSGDRTSWTVTVQLTNALVSHRFDASHAAAQTGGSR